MKKQNKFFLIALAFILTSVLFWEIFQPKKALSIEDSILTIRTCSFDKTSSNSVIDNFHYVSLQNNAAHPVVMGDVYQLKIYKDTIWVLDSRLNLFAFHKDGRLIAQVNKTGDGPGSTFQISDFEIQGNYIYILEMSKPFLQVYDRKSFSFLKNVNLSYEDNFSNLVFWKDHWYFFSPSALSDHPIHVYSNDFKLKYTYLNHAVKNKKFLLIPLQPLIKLKNTLTINMMFNDTIFSFTDKHKLYPNFFIDLCSEKLSNNEIKHLTKAPQVELKNLIPNYLRILNFRENEQFYWLSIFKESKRLEQIIIDKKYRNYMLANDIEQVNNQPISMNFIGSYQDYFISALNEDEVKKIEAVRSDIAKTKPIGVLLFIKFRSPIKK